ncbi:MAG: DUF3179 domain-containing protein [Chloroflexi bacterium]|nr:DUF3179 domain-containing protein [Chloroflexota bacterium]
MSQETKLTGFLPWAGLLVAVLGVGGLLAALALRSGSAIVELDTRETGESGAALDSGLDSLRIISVLPKDAIPAILNPEFVSAEEDYDQVKLMEPVIGVSINGDSRAYSINQLSRHEIVNDMVGGVPIAVTW